MSTMSKLVTNYQKLKLNISQSIAGVDNILTSELEIIDDGYLEAQTKRLKGQYMLVVEELQHIIANQIKNPQRKEELLLAKQEIVTSLLFLYSNNISHLELCKQLLEKDNAFNYCIDGLIAYVNADYKTAYEKINYYHTNYGVPTDHFLLNKALGISIYNMSNVLDAIPFLTKAVMARPTDVESLHALKECYKEQGSNREIIVNNVLELIS